MIRLNKVHPLRIFFTRWRGQWLANALSFASRFCRIISGVQASGVHINGGLIERGLRDRRGDLNIRRNDLDLATWSPENTSHIFFSLKLWQPSLDYEFLFPIKKKKLKSYAISQRDKTRKIVHSSKNIKFLYLTIVMLFFTLLRKLAVI